MKGLVMGFFGRTKKEAALLAEVQSIIDAAEKKESPQETLIRGIQSADRSLIKKSIEDGADMNACSAQGYTPPMTLAQARGDEEETKRLTETSPQEERLVDLSEFGLPNISSNSLKQIFKRLMGRQRGYLSMTQPRFC